MMIDYVKQVYASKNFKIKDDFEFVEFDNITEKEEKSSEQIEIWAAVKVYYEGKVPDSYKTLNLIIGDWVESHTKELTKVLHDQLKNHIITTYPDSEFSGILDESESSIWEDQLDYMPRVNEDDKYMIIEIELVLESEVLED